MVSQPGLFLLLVLGWGGVAPGQLPGAASQLLVGEGGCLGPSCPYSPVSFSGPLRAQTSRAWVCVGPEDQEGCPTSSSHHLPHWLLPGRPRSSHEGVLVPQGNPLSPFPTCPPGIRQEPPQDIPAPPQQLDLPSALFTLHPDGTFLICNGCSQEEEGMA